MAKKLAIGICLLLVSAGRAQDKTGSSYQLPDIQPQAIPPKSKPDSMQKSKPACLAAEPDINQIVEQTWAQAGLSKVQDESRKTRVRFSGWLPKISGGLSQDIGGRWDYKYEAGSTPVDQFHYNDGLRWDVGLSWDLSKIAFRSEELQVARETSKRALERMEIATMVIGLYFTRFRLTLQGLPEPGSDRAIKFLEATAILDAWTGGKFKKSWCEVKP